jgi:hypothetical protein
MEPRYNFNTFDLGEIFRSVWGYTAAPFLFSLQNKVESKIFGKENGSSEYVDFSPEPARQEVNMKGVRYYAENDNCHEMFLPIWLYYSENGTRRALLLQNTVSSFANKKTIVETPLVNRKGTVKEEISTSDWQINVRGIIVSQDGNYPEERVNELREWYERGEALEIENARASLLLDGNEMVVINDLKFPEIRGNKNMQAFEMNLTSDLNFDLYIE